MLARSPDIRRVGPEQKGRSALWLLIRGVHNETMTDISNAPEVVLASDLARRVTHRRNDLGLSVEELASRAGIDPGYLRYFERSPNASLSAGTLQLVALALDTTPLALLGGEVDRPPGHGRAGRHPALETLSEEQCDAHLAVGGVGRVVYSSPRGPLALPVNFEFTEGEVIFSTDESKAAKIDRELVGFEVDRVDEAMSEGWSVLVTGHARRIEDPEELQRLGSIDLEAWAGGDRHSLIGIRPEEISGRVIVHYSPPDQD
jgi:transcriptional regulator with XRE-family HTH domain